MTTIVTRTRYCDICKRMLDKNEDAMEIDISEFADKMGGRLAIRYDVCKECACKVRALFIGDGNEQECY